jgi:hypothetical protein
MHAEANPIENLLRSYYGRESMKHRKITPELSDPALILPWSEVYVCEITCFNANQAIAAEGMNRPS